MFIVYHFTWERKPNYTFLINNGKFDTWEESFCAAFNNLINGDIDEAEISSGDTPPPVNHCCPIFTKKEELVSHLEEIGCQYSFVDKFVFDEFADFSYGIKRFHIKRI